ncbi:MAG: hypothetical protein AAGC88_02025 [Bacteroidota bacterium]
MKKALIYFLALFLINSSCSKKQGLNPIDLSNWEFKMISQGDNSPTFRPSKDSIQFIPILLRKGYPIEQIQEHLGWSQEELDEKCEELSKNGFIKKVEGKYLPTVMVISDKDANQIRQKIDPLAREIALAIEQKIDTIKIMTSNTSCLSSFDFEDLSLLILSNILLDNGQIRNVENEYLKSERPLRNGKRYYAAYGEKPNDRTEAWHVYGNQVEMNDGFAMCRYGNERYTDEVIAINDSIIAKYKRSGALDLAYPIFNNQCYVEVLELANYFKPHLIRILSEHTPSLEALYAEMKYTEEVTYEEFFIWIYHILYSHTTDILLESRLLSLPEEKVSFYIVELE